jgi:hypothetical protein
MPAPLGQCSDILIPSVPCPPSAGKPQIYANNSGGFEKYS